MIINKDINPERSLYYIGSRIIHELSKHEGKTVDFLEVYQGIQGNEHITMNLYSLSLDWLFLNNVIEIRKNGIKKCF